MKNISKVLKHIRKFNRLTQRELSSQLNICRSYISEIESGKKIPSFEVLTKYSIAFDLPLSVVLLFAENWEQKNTLKGNLKHKLTKVALSFLDWVCKYNQIPN